MHGIGDAKRVFRKADVGELQVAFSPGLHHHGHSTLFGSHAAHGDQWVTVGPRACSNYANYK